MKTRKVKIMLKKQKFVQNGKRWLILREMWRQCLESLRFGWVTCSGIFLVLLESFDKRLVNAVTHQISSHLRNSKPLPVQRECKHPDQFVRMHSASHHVTLRHCAFYTATQFSLLAHRNKVLCVYSPQQSQRTTSRKKLLTRLQSWTDAPWEGEVYPADFAQNVHSKRCIVNLQVCDEPLCDWEGVDREIWISIEK